MKEYNMQVLMQSFFSFTSEFVNNASIEMSKTAENLVCVRTSARTAMSRRITCSIS